MEKLLQKALPKLLLKVEQTRKPFLKRLQKQSLLLLAKHRHKQLEKLSQNWPLLVVHLQFLRQLYKHLQLLEAKR